MNLGHLLLGKPLATKDLPHQAISKRVGLAVFASDALSSTAYATQEILVILSIAAIGSTAIWQTQGNILAIAIPIAIAISILLAIVTISYRQTIFAYPNGGGAYIVARDNLGETPAQVAGAALLTDYILTVAVSISAGVAQITSFFPELAPLRVHIAVAVIGLMTLVNLRGVKESGTIFAIPTYFFLGVMLLTLAAGFVRLLGGSLGVIPPDSVEIVPHLGESLVTPEAAGAFIFLILRAFSSGCTALTGIEAISNGIQAFHEPRSKNAAKTLVVMSSVLIVLFIGITVLAVNIHAIPSEHETVISQLGRSVFGANSMMHFLLLGGTALILLMAANTSYADFPRLAALIAADGFLPRQLTNRGGRLVFSWGILFLSLAAALLVIIGNASTTTLIPLYAIGVFLSFTMSQYGMYIHMGRVGKLKPGEEIQGLETVMKYDPHWHRKQIISLIGAICTFVVMVIFAITKFTHGAWFIVILIPLLVLVFFKIHHHYKSVAHELSLAGSRPDTKPRTVQTIILIDDVHRETARLVNVAKSLRHPWKAIHVAVNPEKALKVEQKWNERIGEGELLILQSPYRLLAEPIADYIEDIQKQEPSCFVHIIVGHLAMDTFWEQALHSNSSLILNLIFSRMENVVFTTVPYRIHTHEEDDAEDTKREPEQQELTPTA
ncbi:MAG: APC family permease [Anaerolineae bacterium]|nr:APC family permease [Anaerolineae bacterium]